MHEQAVIDSKERKLAHSDKLVLPRITAPPARRLAATVESVVGGVPCSANEPAVVCILSAVAMCALRSSGMPGKGPSTAPSLRITARVGALGSASGFSPTTQCTPGALRPRL